MDIQRHSSVLGDTVEKLSDEASYKQLFHAYRDEEALPAIMGTHAFPSKPYVFIQE